MPLQNAPKELFEKLIKCKDESEVDKVLSNIENEKNFNWWPFNGDSSNFSQINNQQSDSVSALSEKVINSIDALLLKACKENGIDPEAKNAPTSMKDAAEKFFKIKDGNLSELGDAKRRDLASKIRIIAEGSLKIPTIIVADFGEGQNPTDFKTTLLSLGRKNKQKTQFVQGKYGMGGTGVIPFCGDGSKNYVFILSRKYPKLLKSDQQDAWGFTLIRKAPDSHLDPMDRHGYWECLVDEKNEILSFAPESLEILPGKEKMEYGCYIKLFNYDLQYNSFVTLDLWRALNRRLYAPVLPVLIQETREFPGLVKGKNDTKIMLGNKFRILKDEHDYINKELNIKANLGAFDERNVDLIVFKDVNDKGESIRKKSEWTTADEEVFLTVNGQTFNTLSRYWVASTSNLEPLSDYMLIHIDCTDVNRNVADPIFLGSKDRVRENKDYRQFKDTLSSILKDNAVLQKLNEEYKRRALERLIPDKSVATALIKNLIYKNKALADYFGVGTDIPTEPGEDIKQPFVGKEVPTFLNIAKKYTGEILVKEVPLNSHRIVLLLTDAKDNYLQKVDGGKLIVENSNNKFGVYAWYLSNGLLPIYVKIQNAVVDDEEDITIKLTRPNLEPLSVKVRLKAIASYKKQKRPANPIEGTEKGIALPKLVVVKEKSEKEEEKKWSDFNWHGTDISKVEKGVAVYVNMDSDDLKSFLNSCAKSLVPSAEILYKVGIYLNSILLDMELDKLQVENKDVIFNTSLRTLSKTILPLYFDKKVQNAISESNSPS